MTTRDIGFQQEDVALRYLLEKGLTLLYRNYSCKLGEIDLIMQEGDKLVFIEVRYRYSTRYGGSAASVSRTKQEHLIRTAGCYLRDHHPRKNPICRFDVIAINGDNGAPLNWIRNAFYAHHRTAF